MHRSRKHTAPKTHEHLSKHTHARMHTHTHTHTQPCQATHLVWCSRAGHDGRQPRAAAVDEAAAGAVVHVPVAHQRYRYHADILRRSFYPRYSFSAVHSTRTMDLKPTTHISVKALVMPYLSKVQVEWRRRRRRRRRWCGWLLCGWLLCAELSLSSLLLSSCRRCRRRVVVVVVVVVVAAAAQAHLHDE